MQYLVHIENKNYFLWQVYILAESLRLLGLQDDLVIAYSTPEGSPIPVIPGEGFPCQHIGQDWGCPSLTKFFAGFIGLKLGIVKQPFIILEPDTIIRREVKPSETPISGQYHKSMERTNVELVYGYAKLPTDKWYPVKDVYQFNSVPVSFFEDTLTACKYVIDNFGKQHLFRNSYWYRDVVGIALGISRSGLPCTVVKDYQSPLDQRSLGYEPEANIVRYDSGYLPYFKKMMYDESMPFYRSPFPFEDITKIPDHKENENVTLLKQVTSSFVLNNRNYFTS